MLSLIFTSSEFPFYFDDAFISFRITENIRSGIGPYLFAGQHVYTSTSLIYPFINLLPALLHGEHWIEYIPIWNACWMALAICICFRQAAMSFPVRKPVFYFIAALVLLPWMLEKRNIIYGNSGLETSIYMAGLAAVLLLRKWKIVSPWLIFIRPEGILAGIAVLLDSVWKRNKNDGIQMLIQLLVAVACWMISGYLLFDTPLPQSILAKANHFVDRKNEILSGLGYALFAAHLLPMALVFYAAYRHPEFRDKIRLTTIWMALYLFFFSFVAGWWPWYSPPLYLGFWYISFAAIFRLSDNIQISTISLSAVAILLSVYSARQIQQELDTMKKHSSACKKRMDASQEIANLLKTSLPSGTEILLEPMGMLVWYAPELKITDYPGLANPKMTRFLGGLKWKIPHRLTDPKTDSAILQNFRPEVLLLWPEESAAFQKVEAFRKKYQLWKKLPYFLLDPRMDSVGIYRKIRN